MTTTGAQCHIETRKLDSRILGEVPFWRCAALFGPDSHCFLLDSALSGGKLGRYSFLGGDPAAVLTARRVVESSVHAATGQRAHLTLNRWKGTLGDKFPIAQTREWEGEPFAALRDLHDEYWPNPGEASRTDPTPPFRAGLVGYFGYEAGYFLERLPNTGHDDLRLPDLAFMVVDEVLVWDHPTGSLSVTVTGRGIDNSAARTDAVARADRWPIRLQEFVANEAAGNLSPNTSTTNNPLEVNTHFDRDDYCAAVQKCRDHILAGDVFEVCLTNRMETVQPGSAWDLYKTLRRINPAPFASYLQFPDFQVVGSSPERFLRLDSEGIAESRPIKGTRPRGKTAAEDEALRRELALSPKDRAENLMIVDLVRSDLGRVAEIGSVTVPELLVVEEYATVFQLISTIRARLRDDCDALDLVQACFPGGSMTGAPKIEAMKIIDSIEPTKRGVYSGAIGYLDFAGAMDLSIVIRSIVCKAGRCTFGAGGAVVADSDPAAEYQEMLDKAKALIEALAVVNGDEDGPTGGSRA
jgi:para-aminobenzoate synthetase component I